MLLGSNVFGSRPGDSVYGLESYKLSEPLNVRGLPLHVLSMFRGDILLSWLIIIGRPAGIACPCVLRRWCRATRPLSTVIPLCSSVTDTYPKLNQR